MKFKLIEGTPIEIDGKVNRWLVQEKPASVKATSIETWPTGDAVKPYLVKVAIFYEPATP